MTAIPPDSDAIGDLTISVSPVGALIRIGDALDRSFLTRVMDMSTLSSLKFVMPPPMSGVLDPVKNPTPWGNPGMSKTTPWVAGYANDFQTVVNGANRLYWSGNSGQIDANPTAAGLAAGLGAGVISVSAGSVVIQPRPATAAELATMGGNAALTGRTWLSGAVCTFPAGLPVPRYFEARVALGAPTAGAWPAFWDEGIDDQWNNGPEVDYLERFGSSGLTTSVHSSTGVAWSNQVPSSTTYVATGTATQVLSLPDSGAGAHTYGALTLKNQIAIFIDGICVQVWPTPDDMAKIAMYPILNYGIGAPGSIAGTPAVGAKLPPMVISDFGAYTVAPGYVTQQNAPNAALLAAIKATTTDLANAQLNYNRAVKVASTSYKQAYPMFVTAQTSLAKIAADLGKLNALV